MQGLIRRLMRRWELMGVVAALAGGTTSASAQTTNSPLHPPSFGAPAQPSQPAFPGDGWPAWQGMPGGGYGRGGLYTPPPALPSRIYPTDRTPALRDLTQRPVSPLDNAARDAGVRQQVFPAPANEAGTAAEPVRRPWR